MNIENLLEPVFSRIRLMIGRCVVLATKYNSSDLEADIELVAGEKRRDVEFVQQYGFSSRPKGDVSGIALFVGGSRDNGVVVATHGDGSDMSAAKDLKPGEVMVHAPFGQTILLKEDGNIELKCGGPLNKVICHNDFECKGNVRSEKEVSALYNGTTAVNLSMHPHPSAVGPTGTPTLNPVTP